MKQLSILAPGRLRSNARVWSLAHACVCLWEHEAGAGMGDGVIPKTLLSSPVLAASNA